MQKLSPHPRIKLSRLRDIGWELWDPIGLLRSERFYPGKWNEEDSQPFADEYDGYLIFAAGQLRRGTPQEEIIEYLINIETEHMGLGDSPGVRERAQAVVAAILVDKSIWTWPDENGCFR